MSGHHGVGIEELLGVSTGLLRELAARSNNIDQDRYDQRMYRELVGASSEMRQLEQARGFATWPALLQDIWAIYYKASPEMVSEELVDPAYLVNRGFASRILEDPATAETRITTVLDEFSAGLATLATGRKLLQEIQQRENLQKAMRMVSEAVRMAEGSERRKPDDLAAEGQARYALEHVQAAAKDLRRAVREAAREGTREVEQMQQILAGWGLEPGDLKRVPLAERLQVYRRLSQPRMRNLADLVGRFRNLARARQKQKMRRQRDEIHRVTLGNDLARVLPSELAMLKHPLRRLDFYRRYTEAQLLEYELRAEERKGRGPMVVLVDCSGSMSGQPLDWAVAVALGLVDTAARQRRWTTVVFFDTRILAEVEFAPGEKDAQKIVQVATMGAAGGTDYEPALARAREKIASVAQYRQADVVLITDGVCRVGDEFLAEFLEAKRRLEFRVWSVLVGQDPYGELKRWSDRVWTVGRLTDEVAGDVFEEVY